MRIFLALQLLLVAAPCLAEEYPALIPMPKEYLTAPGELIEVKNMPEARSQGALPVCYGISAWYLYVQTQCKANRWDCRFLDDSKVPSVLALSALGIDAASAQRLKTSKIVPYTASGGVTDALHVLAGEEDIPAESCYSLERLLKINRGNVGAMAESFAGLKSGYFDKGVAACVPCLLDMLRVSFGVDLDETTARKALKKESFETFLYDIFLGQCKSKVSIPEFSGRSWPNVAEQKSFEAFVNRLVELLINDIPVAAEICLNQKASEKRCESGHSLVITGYRKICAPRSKECRSYIKVQSTWGREWQRLHSDGWIDARTLYAHLDGGLIWMDRWAK